jgi:hypothetical protein
MSQTKPQPKAGDRCPQCGGPFRKATVPTDEQRAAATNRENPTVLPPNSDTATKEQIAELGVLHTCLGCKYQTRIKEGGDDAPRGLEAHRDAALEAGKPAPDARDAELVDLRQQLADQRARNERTE